VTEPVTQTSTSSQGGGTPEPAPVVLPSVPGPITQAPVAPVAPFTAPSLQAPPKALAALAGSAHLKGRVVSAALRCSKAGSATLSSKGSRLASTRFTCRGGKASVRFTLSRRAVTALKRSSKPALVIAVRVGATTTKLRPRLAH
jgi:hypothetical protein